MMPAVDRHNAGSREMEISDFADGLDAFELHRDNRQEQDEQVTAGREARRLESDLRRRESEVAHMERRIMASKENLRYKFP